MKINISIDDVSPHPMSSIRVLNRCFELISQFPEIKFSIFVPIAYWRTIRKEVSTQNSLSIDQFPDFCETLRNLPAKNFEVCYHGLYHGIPGKSDNDEFQNLTKNEALEKFRKMFEIVDKSNLKQVFKPIFRPPAWRMSSEAIEAAKESGIQILALSPKDYAKKFYNGSENTFPKVVYYNCAPPFDPLIYLEKNEIVYHACEWDKNYLSVDQTKELSNYLKSKNFTFCFLEEMTQ